MNSPCRFLLLASLCMVSACGETSVKETLGMGGRAPDEFRVVSRPPLSVPPQFELRPPGEGQSPTMIEARDKAQSIVLGDENGEKAKSAKSSADEVFLKRAGAEVADPNIKRELKEQKVEKQIEKEEGGWWSRNFGIMGDKEPVVEADGEAERIKTNKAEGKPVNEGKVPETGGGTISTLQRWLGRDE